VVRIGVARLDVTRCRPLLRTLHIASLNYAIVIESIPWPRARSPWLKRGSKVALASNLHTDRFWCVFSMQLYIPTCRVVSRCVRGACLHGGPIGVPAALCSPERRRSLVTETR